MGLDIGACRSTTGFPKAPGSIGARVWEIDDDWVQSRFESKRMMEMPGIPSTRWFDAVTLPKDQVEQKDNIKAMLVFGHSPNTIDAHSGGREGN